MSVNLHILKASGGLEKLEPQIRTAFDESLNNIRNIIDLPSVDVVIDEDASSVIPETGVGGFAPSGHLLYIHIDPDFGGIEQNIHSEIKSTLAHELHHCARWVACGYGKTLFEAIISEGLADHFDIEINGGEPRPWSTAIKGIELKELKEKAKSEFANEEYNHSAWFFGSDKENIPRWSGYSLGFSIVGEYLRKRGKKASELVSENASSFTA